MTETKRVTRQLRDEILDGVRPPGDKLVERELATALGVSRIPVREALQALVAEGLVTLRPRSWAVVRVFTDSDIADLNEVRTAFEPLTFRLAAERRTPEGLKRLRATLDAHLTAARAGNAVVARRKAADFHEQVTELASNDLLTELHRPLSSRIRWLLTQHDDLLAVAHQHESLYTAIANRNTTEAEHLAADHLATSRTLLTSQRSGI